VDEYEPLVTGGLGAVSLMTWARFMGIFRSGSGITGARVDDLRALGFALQRMVGRCRLCLSN
jgi:hypothetical protein